MTPVDVIVCAHNEQDTVGAVLEAILDARSLGRCILVADRCTDQTVDVVVAHQRDHEQLLLVVAAAGDKGSAMAEGLRFAGTETVAFVDADLSGLTTAHIDQLLEHPPRPGMVVGLRSGWPVYWGLFPAISGERRIPRVLAEESGLAGAGWEAELRINAACQKAGLPWAHIVLEGVTNPRRNKPDEWLKVTGAAIKHAGPLGRMLAATRRVRP